MDGNKTIRKYLSSGADDCKNSPLEIGDNNEVMPKQMHDRKPTVPSKQLTFNNCFVDHIWTEQLSKCGSFAPTVMGLPIPPLQLRLQNMHGDCGPEPHSAHT